MSSLGRGSDQSTLRRKLSDQLQRVSNQGEAIHALVETLIEPADLETLGAPENENAQLGGWTYTAKDCIAVSDSSLTMGLHPPLIERSAADAEVICKLRAEGALLIGRAVMDPLAASGSGVDLHYLRPVNPADSELPVLGSSSGCAAAVAANWCDFGLGSDAAGSVRAPAASCGLWGIRLGSTVLDREGTVFLSETRDSFGVIASSGMDLETIVSALVQDQSTSDGLHLVALNRQDLDHVGSDVREYYENNIAELSKQFEVTRFTEPLVSMEWIDKFRTLFANDVYRLVREYDLVPSEVSPAVAALAKIAEGLSPGEIRRATRAVNEQSARLKELLGAHAALLTPVLSKPLPRGTGSDASQCFSPFLSMVNGADLPGVCWPNPSGNPHQALQIIAPGGCDVRAIKAARRAAKALGSAFVDKL